MAKQKSKKTKGKQSVKTSSRYKIGATKFSKKLALVIPCYNEAKRIHLLAKALKEFNDLWPTPYEVIVVDDGSSDDTYSILRDRLEGTLSKADRLEIIKLDKNQGKGNALKEGVAIADSDFVLTLDADMASHPLELTNWLRNLPGKTFNSNEILIGSREHKQSNVEGRVGRRILGVLFNGLTQLLTPITASDTQCGFKLYPIDVAKSLFGELKEKGWAHDVELLYRAQLEDVKVVSMPVAWKHVEDEKIAVGKDGIGMVFKTILNVIKIRFDWFFAKPVRDLRSKVSTEKESSVFRLLFASLAIFLLFFMPFISTDYGITGDEYAQKVYGEYIVKHFETGGEFLSKSGENALNMKPNLFYYGGFFDYVAAKIYLNFPNADPYTVRHGLNAFVGFLLIFFTGLLGREVSGSWKMGFFALLFMFLSPRIFGHSMNNPKDIPFAAAYVLSVYNIIKIIKQLPNPGFKAMAMTAVGIALAISIRIGGLLLIGYLGLFVGIAFLWRKDLRAKLTNFSMLTILALKLLVVVVAGYLGGLMFWPYGLEDWVNNPLEALGAMSNFSTGIKMLFEGLHLWSDRLPWYYIPKWLLIASPLFVLLGALIGAGLYFIKDHLKRDHLTVFLTLFTGVFPVAYILYKGSSLYDGMRHFLFIYPIFAIFAALGWYLATSYQQKVVRILSIATMTLLLAAPAFWMVKNHPYQASFFNFGFGGINAAETNYETDYWTHSVKPMTEWFVENIPEVKSGKEVIVTMSTHNRAAIHYFKKLAPNVKVIFQRHHQRYNKSWDYSIAFSRFMNEGHMKSGAWPFEDVVYQEKVDNVTVGVITKLKNEDPVNAYAALKANDLPTAQTLFEKVLEENPKNELAALGLATTLEKQNNLPGMKLALDKAMLLSESHTNTLLPLAVYYLKTAQDDKALDVLKQVAKLNYKQHPSYYYQALIYQKKQNLPKVVDAIEEYAKVGGKIINAYDIGIAASANQPYKQNFFKAKKAYFSSKGNEIYKYLNLSLQQNPDYTPAKEFKVAIDKAVAAQKKKAEKAKQNKK